MPHMVTEITRLAEGTPGQGWSERGYLQLVGIVIGIAIVVYAIRSFFGKK
ncbi:MAG: hypothetical protein HOV79_29180 [Hamadaea sp.]|nr:hypothetical protein [Hamadaea sp.]